MDKAGGEVYNIGGGPGNTLSVWKQFGPILERLLDKPVGIQRGDWRPGDQRIFVSDIRKAKKELKWEPKIGVERGIEKIFDWVKTNQNLFC
jgi:CDP-paratose 2-epimerase